MSETHADKLARLRNVQEQMESLKSQLSALEIEEKHLQNSTLLTYAVHLASSVDPKEHPRIYLFKARDEEHLRERVSDHYDNGPIPLGTWAVNLDGVRKIGLGSLPQREYTDSELGTEFSLGV